MWLIIVGTVAFHIQVVPEKPEQWFWSHLKGIYFYKYEYKISYNFWMTSYNSDNSHIIPEWPHIKKTCMILLIENY